MAGEAALAPSEKREGRAPRELGIVARDHGDETEARWLTERSLAHEERLDVRDAVTERPELPGSLAAADAC